MHTEIYTIKGREYRYEVTNYREGKKIKHRKKYLGPVQPKNKTQKTRRTASVFVRSLTENEKQNLVKKQKDPKAVVRDRAKIILLSSEGKTPKQIAAQMKKDYARTLKVINRSTKILIFLMGKITGGPKITFGRKDILIRHQSQSEACLTILDCKLLYLVSIKVQHEFQEYG